jgi:hypothetical protein
MGRIVVLIGFGLLCLSSVAQAQSRVPDRQIPPSVLNEIRLLENRFDIALSVDCDAERCFSKGCTYVDHAVADRPRAMSLPGLGQDPGPGSVEAQEYLTAARCSFAYEESVESGDVQALSRRLQNKLSKGWTVVSVDHQRLQPLAPYLQEPPEAEPEVEEEPEEVPEPEAPLDWSGELWMTLLPHFYWMIGVGLVTLAGTLLIWAWRRLGRLSIEDQMMLAEIARGDGGSDPGEPETPSPTSDAANEEAFVARQDAAWAARLSAMDVDNPDPEIQALIRELLRTGDMPLLAKAVMRFPDRLLAAFPEGGEVAAAKLELSAYLKTVDGEALGSDGDFFRQLNRHALSAAVAAQGDASVVRSLREEFGAAGLTSLIEGLPARSGALLFALAPADEQREMVRLLSPQHLGLMAESLLQSNRMDAEETRHLFAVLSAARRGEVLPAAPPSDAVSDRGAEFEASGALSVLLESVNPARRATLFSAPLERFKGSLPQWYRGILTADMLLELPDEARADLLLDVDVETLAAWLSVLDAATRARLMDGAPGSLRASVGSVGTFASRARQVALAEQGRRTLARGFQLQLARHQKAFEDVVVAKAGP